MNSNLTIQLSKKTNNINYIEDDIKSMNLSNSVEREQRERTIDRALNQVKKAKSGAQKVVKKSIK